MKKLKYLFLFLMLIPINVFALDKEEVKTMLGNTTTSTCEDSEEIIIAEPVVGETPASTVKYIYKIGEQTIEKEYDIVWYEHEHSLYEIFYILKDSPEGTLMTSDKFEKDKYYEWDFTDESYDQYEDDLDALPESSCEKYEHYYNGNSMILKTQDILFRATKAIEKNNKVELTEAYLVFDSDPNYLLDKELMPETNGLKINIDFSFVKVNDISFYQVRLVNGTNEELEIGTTTPKTSDYIQYLYTFGDDSNIVKPYSSKVIYIIAQYKNEVPADLLDEGYTESNEVELTLGSEATPNADNPKTGISTAIIVIGLTAAVVIGIIRIGIKKKVKYLVLVLGSLFVFVPFTANALKQVTLTIESKVVIEQIKEFKLDDEIYRFEKGMTFKEWMNSSYNVDNIELVDMFDCDTYKEEYVGKRHFEPIQGVSTSEQTIDVVVIEENKEYETELITANTCFPEISSEEHLDLE